MIIKFGSAKIAGVATTPREFKKEFGTDAFVKFSTIQKLDTDRYLYIRNRAVSSMEYYGPNENGDAFPEDELMEKYNTFIGQRVSIDHQDDKIIGYVLSSRYIPYENEKGGFVENIQAIDREEAENQFPGLISLIESGKVTDTSMGALVSYSECSICHNLASNENEYCDHIKYHKMQDVVLSSGEKKKVYEICYDISFFEDSIIVPLELGGMAGGEGADTKAKVLQIISSRSQDSLDYIIDSILENMDPGVLKDFEEDIANALTSSEPIRRTLLVLSSYSAKVDRKTKQAMVRFASILRKFL